MNASWKLLEHFTLMIRQILAAGLSPVDSVPWHLHLACFPTRAFYITFS